MNIFDAIPNDLSNEILESLVENKNVKIERIVSKGHSSPESGWYDQIHNEWVMVVKGKAKLAFDNKEPVILAEGDYLTIEAHQKHKVEWTDADKETIWLAVHY